MMTHNLAPIILFVYNRPWHTRQTVKALQDNSLASDSELFIYSDEAKNETAEQAVKEVRKYIHSINDFKTITVVERDKNMGLADSIIDGVTTVVNQYGKVIVLEDDLVTSPHFLKFMNDALDFYQDKKKVWHISGWNYPIPSDGLDEIFLWRVMNCWGWATWSDRWQFFEKDTDSIIKNFSKEDIKSFNLDGAEGFFGQVIANDKQVIDTWAIFWYATIFLKKGLCLNPVKTFVDNIGLDGTGIHCQDESGSDKVIVLASQPVYRFSNKIVESSSAVIRVREYYLGRKKSFYIRIINLISRTLFKKNTIL